MGPRPRGKQVIVAAGILLALPACLRDPDVNQMKCTQAKGCPAGYSCVSTGGTFRCQPTTSTRADGAVSTAGDAPLAPPSSDGARPETAEVRLDVASRESAGGPEATSGLGDGSTPEPADAPLADAEPTATGTGGNLGLGGSSAGGGATGAGGVTAGAGGSAGTPGTGGAIDGGTADTSGSDGASARDGGADVPLGTGGAGTGGLPGSGGASGTGGRTGSGGAGTGVTPGTGGSSTCSLGGTTGANTLTVDVDGAQTVIGKELFGVLMERLGRQFLGGGLFVGTDSAIPHTNGMRNDVIDGLKEAGVGLIQFPGGCAANGYNWSVSTNPTSDVGTDRFMQLCSLVGAEPYIAGRATAADAASNAAWVDYIQGHAGWSLKYFKLGVEVWGGCGSPQTESAYEASFLANRAALQNKNLFLVAAGAMIEDWTRLETEVSGIGSQIDGIEVHDFIYFPDTISSSNPSDGDYYQVVHLANQGQIRPHVEKVVEILDDHDPSGRIKIVLDEWGDWLTDLGDGWMQQNTVMDAISAAEQLHVFMEHADRIKIAGLAQAINVMQSLFLIDKVSEDLVRTPTFYVFKMFVPHHTSSAKWAPHTLVSENITANEATFPVLSAGTTADSTGRVNISLANVDLVNARSIRITLASSKTSYAVASARIITGPSKNSYNDFGQPESVNIQTLPAGSYSICGRSLNVTLPAKSVVMLAIDPQ